MGFREQEFDRFYPKLHIPCFLPSSEFFHFQPLVSLVGNLPLFVIARDLDGDTNMDLAVANAGEGTVSVLTHFSRDSFAAQTIHKVGRFPGGLASGDLDGDGDLDLVAASMGSTSVLNNSGNGSFSEAIYFETGA